MSSARGNRLYNGKARLAYTRQRADETYVQEQIDGYFEWASRRRGSHPELKIVRRTFPSLGGEDPDVRVLGWESAQDEAMLPFPREAEVARSGHRSVAGGEAAAMPVVEAKPAATAPVEEPTAAQPGPTPAVVTANPADESSKPAEAASPPARSRRHVEPPDKPIRLLRPLPLEGAKRFRGRRLSYGKMAYGFLWGSAAALAILWIADLAMM